MTNRYTNHCINDDNHGGHSGCIGIREVRRGDSRTYASSGLRITSCEASGEDGPAQSEETRQLAGEGRPNAAATSRRSAHPGGTTWSMRPRGYATAVDADAGSGVAAGVGRHASPVRSIR